MHNRRSRTELAFVKSGAGTQGRALPNKESTHRQRFRCPREKLRKALRRRELPNRSGGFETRLPPIDHRKHYPIRPHHSKLVLGGGGSQMGNLRSSYPSPGRGGAVAARPANPECPDASSPQGPVHPECPDASSPQGPVHPECPDASSPQGPVHPECPDASSPQGPVHPECPDASSPQGPVHPECPDASSGCIEGPAQLSVWGGAHASIGDKVARPSSLNTYDQPAQVAPTAHPCYYGCVANTPYTPTTRSSLSTIHYAPSTIHHQLWNTPVPFCPALFHARYEPWNTTCSIFRKSVPSPR